MTLKEFGYVLSGYEVEVYNNKGEELRVKANGSNRPVRKNIDFCYLTKEEAELEIICIQPNKDHTNCINVFLK